MLDGRIAEMGTYDQLLESKGAMAKLLAEHLSESQQQAPASLDVGLAEDPELIELKQVHIQDEAEAHLEHEQASDAKKPIANGGLTTKEERTVGALDGAVVRKYVGSMGGLWVSAAIPLAPSVCSALTMCFLLALLSGHPSSWASICWRR